MEELTMGTCRVVGVAVVLCVMYMMWTSLLLLGLVVTAVMLMWRYVALRQQVALPAEGRVVLITGCDTGIGHEVALAASERGLTVVASCLNLSSPGARRLATTKRVHVLHMDVTSHDSVKSAVVDVSKICGDKGLWAVLNNAGFNRQAPVELTSMDTFHHVADVMLFGTVLVTKAFLPLIRRAKGRVVTLSSDRGMLSPAHSAAYCIAKHGVETFSDVLREEMKQFGVSVSIIQPGHFGAATAIINSQALEAMRASMERDLQACSKEVQQVYGGEQAVQKIIDNCLASRDSSATDVTPVVQAILHALLNSQPASRYPVHGTTGPVDWGIVLGQIKQFLPDTVFARLQTIVMRV